MLYKNLNNEWHLRSGKNVTIIELAEMFGDWTLIEERRGERFTSEEFYSDTEELLEWKPLIGIEKWIQTIKKNQKQNLLIVT